MLENVVAQIVQELRQPLKSGAVTLMSDLSFLAISQQHAMGGSPYGRWKCNIYWQPTSPGDTIEWPSHLADYSKLKD